MFVGQEKETKVEDSLIVFASFRLFICYVALITLII